MTCRTSINHLTTEVALEFAKIILSNILHMFLQRLVRGFVMDTVSFCYTPEAENLK